MADLETKIKKLKNYSWADEYFNYISYLERGLRKNALNSLSNFIISYQSQTKEERRYFMDDLLTVAFTIANYSALIPWNLDKIFLKDINEWINDEPYNPKAFLWSPQLEHNKIALELNPYDEISIEKLGKRVISKITMNQHELEAGYGYQGNPLADLELINFFERYIDNLNDKDKKQKILQEIREIKNIAIDYNARNE